MTTAAEESNEESPRQGTVQDVNAGNVLERGAAPYDSDSDRSSEDMSTIVGGVGQIRKPKSHHSRPVTQSLAVPLNEDHSNDAALVGANGASYEESNHLQLPGTAVDDRLLAEATPSGSNGMMTPGHSGKIVPLTSSDGQFHVIPTSDN